MRREIHSAAFLVVGLFLGLTGCKTQSHTIIDPPANITKAESQSPITKLTVSFHSHFQPGTFHAKLDGVNVTSQFSPPAAPGGTSSMNVGTWKGPYHTLQTSANVSGVYAFTDDARTFYVPYFQTGFPDPVFVSGVKQQHITVPVQVHVAPLKPLTVTVTPKHPFVSLNGQPAGQPITVTIPTNQTQATFDMLLLTGTGTHLTFTSPGCADGDLGVEIK